MQRRQFIQQAAGTALAPAWTGDEAGARKLESDLKKQFPVATLLNVYWLPTIDARIELAKNNPAGAVEILQSVQSPLELGIDDICLNAIYARGEAYLAAGQGSAAAGEFQKILDHAGIVLDCAKGALARLGLARAYALEAGLGGIATPALRNHGGTTVQTSMNRGTPPTPRPDALAKARAAYEDFLTLWKDADPDLPILKQAKEEYARLDQVVSLPHAHMP